MSDPLAAFSAPTRNWFRRAFGRPTPPQAQGWPPIQRGEHTLITAPTGSGKTLAAFLWGIDKLCREPSAAPDPDAPELRLVYISPLKALNNDIERNLRVPLAGIREEAAGLGLPFPDIRVAVRSGDTPQPQRQAMLRRSPHILITTPESLYLLLTSPRAHEMFRRVRTVIVDEIHTLAGTKRGVHLALSLERLVHLAAADFQRIGLSATIRPLDEAARFLGGGTLAAEGRVVPRPVHIVDTHYHKPLDLQVITAVDDFASLPGGSIWPAVIPRVLELVRAHHTTLIFCNNRRLAERTAERLNELAAAEAEGRPSPLIRDGVADGLGIFATGTGERPGAIRAHHGSVSREARLAMEEDLKAGRLPALVATSSLELGIDIGAVDLVVQLQSPRSVAQGLQRVGRSGHLVGQTAVGRVFPTFREEVIEAAAVAGGMLGGEVEPTFTPHTPLDVLAQHIVSMVAVQPWDVEALYGLVRRAYAYHDLSWEVYQSVLEMVSGRWAAKSRRELQARVAWDRVNNRLAALPGSRLLALSNGGTIPDQGSYWAYLSDGKTKLGELDEEFVYETRRGDVFMLGSQSWRVLDITDDRVLVTAAPGAVARMPFWHGDYPWRPYETGRAVGAFRREVAERLLQSGLEPGRCHEFLGLRGRGETPPLIAWLQRDHALDENSAWQAVAYVAGQLDAVGAVSSDRTIVVEAFRDELGTPRIVIESPFGGRVNGPWGLALASALRERTGLDVEVGSTDDGILLRAMEGQAEVPLDFVARLTSQEVRERILQDLPDSAVFGARFRQNAARALLLPGRRPGKRTPFWLQRLRARDLLQAVRTVPDFPILVETFRDCLEDVMDLPHLEQVLRDIQEGRIQVLTVEAHTPSPVAVGLIRHFISTHLYDWDAPKAERHLRQLAVDRSLLQDVLKDVALDELLRPEAVEEVTARLQHTAPTAQARTPDELAVLFEQVGDLSTAEVEARTAGEATDWLRHLAGAGRIAPFAFPGRETRWVHAEYAAAYAAAFDDAAPSEATRRDILGRYLEHVGPVTVTDILARYPFPAGWLNSELDRLVEAGRIARGRFTPTEDAAAPPTEQFLDRHNLGQIHRRTLALLRREVRPVPRAVYADFLARWQHLHPAARPAGPGALVRTLQQLRGIALPARIWERDVLPLRLARYDPAELEALCQSGELVWIGDGGTDPHRSRVRFIFRGEGHLYLPAGPPSPDVLSAPARAVYDLLQAEGALFFSDMHTALGLSAETLEQALLELVLNGWVTSDSLEAMRYIVGTGRAEPRGDSPAPRPWSTLEAQLRERGGRPALRGARDKPGPARYRAARRRVAERLGFSPAAAHPRRSPLHAGRWSLVYRLGIMGRDVPPEERTARQARQLLQRWGVVTRDIVDIEEGAWDWGAIFARLRLMEMRGEVRRGYFVEGLAGIQFALPEAVEPLRARRDAPPDEEDAPVVLNAADPANLYGGTLADGPLAEGGAPLTFSRLPSTWLVQRRGRPVLVAHGAGRGIVTVQGATEEEVWQALAALLEHLSRTERRVTVKAWNSRPVLSSAAPPLLESLGFRRDYPGMTWERPVD